MSGSGTSWGSVFPLLTDRNYRRAHRIRKPTRSNMGPIRLAKVERSARVLRLLRLRSHCRLCLVEIGGVHFCGRFPCKFESNKMRNATLLLIAVVCLLGSTAGTQAAEPGWTNRVIKVGEDRQRSQATPILQRPYRPLHFYGNTVRRRHYRGNAAPAPRDMWQTAVSLAGR